VFVLNLLRLFNVRESALCLWWCVSVSRFHVVSLGLRVQVHGEAAVDDRVSPPMDYEATPMDWICRAGPW